LAHTIAPEGNASGKSGVGGSKVAILSAARSTPSRVGRREYDSDESGLGFVILIF
jgi:hypothetical protein